MSLDCPPGKGFTLIELMIVVGVMAILTAIAYPAYQDYVRRARRVEGQGTMLNIQLLEEKWRVNHPIYLGTLSSLGTFTSAYYTFAISGTSGTAYTITATAKDSQLRDTGCAQMTLDQAGKKCPEPDKPGMVCPTKSDCWKD